jgi:hypothetical protein
LIAGFVLGWLLGLTVVVMLDRAFRGASDL